MPGWDDADVPAHLSRRLAHVPVLVDNDVNVMALGEHTSQWPTVDHLLFVKVATGIGAGIISDGQIRRGAQGAAGDLGHIAVPGGPSLPADAATPAASRPCPAARRSPTPCARSASTR